MGNATAQRREAVLRAIVADYIATHEPVGSKSLLARHGLNVSSATIRNDMAALEQDGYIMSQHTSSGRIPTEKAYRVFVDSLHEIKPLTAPERRAIMQFLAGGVDLEDVLRRSAQLLSQLTGQAAMVQLPRLSVSRLLRVEVVLLQPTRILLVVITDNGRVDQRNVEFSSPLSEATVATLREVLNRDLAGKTIEQACDLLGNWASDTHPDLVGVISRCADVLQRTLAAEHADRLILAGAANLTRPGEQAFTAALEALEEQVVFLKLLSAAPEPGRVAVSIGEENANDQLRATAVVSAGYGTGQTIGGLGVVGPTYMDYPANLSKVMTVATYVSRILGNA